MKNYIFSIGLNDKDSKQQEILILDAFKIASNLLIKYFGGGTVNESRGVYTHEDGTVIIENTLTCKVITDKDVNKFIEDAKTTFNQESIMVEEINSSISFK